MMYIPVRHVRTCNVYRNYFIADLATMHLLNNHSLTIVAMCSDVEILEIIHHTRYDVKCFCVSQEPYYMKVDSGDTWIISTEVQMLSSTGMMASTVDQILKDSSTQGVLYIRQGTSVHSKKEHIGMDSPYNHCGDVTRASRRSRSPVTWIFVPQFVMTKIYKTSKHRITLPFRAESTERLPL